MQEIFEEGGGGVNATEKLVLRYLNPVSVTVALLVSPKISLHFLKAIGLTVNLRYLGTLYVHPVTRQIFLDTLDRNCLN